MMLDPYLRNVELHWRMALEFCGGCEAEMYAASAVERRQLYIDLPETPLQDELHDLLACLEARVWVDDKTESECRELISEFHEWVEWLDEAREIREDIEANPDEDSDE